MIKVSRVNIMFNHERRMHNTQKDFTKNKNEIISFDIENVIVQSTKAVSSAQGKHIEKGPSLERLKE